MKRFVFLLIVMIVLVVGLTAAWFVAAQIVKTQLASTMTAMTTSEQSISCEQIDVAGFPFRFDVTCTNVQFSQLDTHFSLPEIKATVLVYRPTHVLAFVQSPLQVVDEFSGTRRAVKWESLQASARTNQWSFARVSIDAEGIEISDNLIGELRLAEIDRFEAHIIDAPQHFDEAGATTALDIFARVENLELTQLNLTGANLLLEAQLAAIPSDIRNWNAPTLQANWIDFPTAISLHKLDGDDEISSFHTVGQFGVTAQGLLTGDVDLFTSNVAERLQTFIDPIMLQLVLGLPDNEGGLYQSFALRHGVLMAGNIPMMAIPALFVPN